ncbi:Hypothetical_protein [Hexamita inflata]|uniref:Hypothetical_protein n=1 Tax=Hexamita inflata TaxID=28002 RepID=A0AA86NQB7_9EUKA|nr:Hypothetical protein HINF_LOCUS10430 [Hexamita inflata]
MIFIGTVQFTQNRKNFQMSLIFRKRIALGNLLVVYKSNCTAIMYKKKLIRRDEINDREDVIPGNQNNRFTALVSDDIRIPKKHPHAAINEYLANTVRQTTQPNVQATIQKKSDVKPKSKKQKPKRKLDIPVDTIGGISPTQY